jgi:hypothetical protein
LIIFYERNSEKDFTKEEVLEMAPVSAKKSSDELILLEKRKKHRETQKRLEEEKVAFFCLDLLKLL